MSVTVFASHAAHVVGSFVSSVGDRLVTACRWVWARTQIGVRWLRHRLTSRKLRYVLLTSVGAGVVAAAVAWFTGGQGVDWAVGLAASGVVLGAIAVAYPRAAALFATLSICLSVPGTGLTIYQVVSASPPASTPTASGGDHSNNDFGALIDALNNTFQAFGDKLTRLLDEFAGSDGQGSAGHGPTPPSSPLPVGPSGPGQFPSGKGGNFFPVPLPSELPAPPADSAQPQAPPSTVPVPSTSPSTTPTPSTSTESPAAPSTTPTPSTSTESPGAPSTTPAPSTSTESPAAPSTTPVPGTPAGSQSTTPEPPAQSDLPPGTATPPAPSP
jgi:hypothetical protein